MKQHKPKSQGLAYKRLPRRALILGGLQAAFIGGLAARMRYMQVDQADEYRLLAEENRINIRLIPPTRGRIYDRNGQIIGQNSPSYRIVMVREDAGDVDEVLTRLSSLIPLTEDEMERAKTEMRRSAPFLPVTLADQVTWEDISKVAVNAPALPGVTPEVGMTRQYPRYEDFAHVVGYVGPVSDYDLSQIDDPEPVLRIPRFQIGKVGLEAKQESTLRGKAGAKRVEVNATGRVMRELDRQEGEAGADLQLSVDADLQQYAQARLEGESAAAVVIDCETGDIRAISSAPSFDPNLFVRGISVGDYRTLTQDNYRPLANKTVQGTYPPGSTFKMITAMAALEAGVIGPGNTVYCPGHLKVGSRRFHCWKRGGHGTVDLNLSLKRSCDVYYYDVALRTGIDKISDMARVFGLGVKHDIPMSAVAAGLAPNQAWKERVHGESWLVGDTANASIGQGFMLASPLQLAVMTARIATGREVKPRLVRSINGVEEPSGLGEPLAVNPNNLEQVRKAMFSVSNDRGGTAYRSRIIADDLRMAGKTGTSQVRNITKAERAAGVIRNEDLPWERRDHALFVSFAPYDKPKYAIAVVVEHGGGGSKAAAPVARDIMLQALYNGTPPLEAYPVADRERIKEQQKQLEGDRRPKARPTTKDRA
ncbi:MULTISPECIES: penicillin-binding protein 2 [unclassified Ruegeria]|uniref:penicillin-binding protein 2 n=1 Tax=unclassified Ruegeria TaxID=2625375 RepID=UPI001ADC633C|nr:MULTISPECIES: penicillin-binding protein 2 [unclassified Ruegeria]MBO9411492.1 penicillin-binding protein 2 [Ruegeria sp. R8_1]MBO9415946.1 penicillin-binding protein 2 [Ruegeria sp. R8_2]